MAYGSGLKETGVLVDEWAEFVVDTTLAGEEANLQIEAFDDEYNVVEVELEPSDTVGLISCRYKPTKPGQHRIFISYAGVSISGGPFRVRSSSVIGCCQNRNRLSSFILLVPFRLWLWIYIDHFICLKRQKIFQS